MKVISWNCNMAFRKKAILLAPFNADLIIVPECEQPEKLLFENGALQPTNIEWFGTNQHKGLGIFSYGNYKLEVLDTYNPDLKTIIPIAVTNGRQKFFLLAIWAYNPADKDGVYVEQVWKALHWYDSLLDKKNILLVGDFNSNTIWDKKHRKGNHTDVVEYLEKKKILSCYHHIHKQEQALEKHPTFYLYRHEDKPYHIDYCFASKNLLATVSDVQIGDYHTWIHYSDHVPVITTFNL